MRILMTLTLGALLSACGQGAVQSAALQPLTASTPTPGYWVTGTATTPDGQRAYKLWVPDGYSGNQALPLVLMLHGCTQNPDDFAAGTRMNTLANTQKFLAVYPDQPREANANKCWNWFELASQGRGAGEPALLAEVVRSVKAAYNVKSNRVYVAGMSAGGAMAIVMGATYPDVFAAVGVGAGLEYQAGTDLSAALLAQVQGGPDPDRQGAAAYAAMGAYKSRVPVVVFHGTSDATVAPVNAEQVIRQWVQTNDLVDDGVDNDSLSNLLVQEQPGTVPGGRSYLRTSSTDAQGRTVFERWMVTGMTHAWSGGSRDGSYADPTGPDASGEMWRFFSQWTRAD